MALPFFRYLDTAGDGTGTKNANGDYSGAVEEFYYEATGDVEIHRMIVSIEDAGGGTVQEYGNLNAALSNGISVRLDDENGNTVIDLTDQLPIQTNGDWGSLCYDIDRKDWGGGNDMFQARWTFARSGSPLKLQSGWKLIVSLNDNLTGLVGHYFMVQGS